tara:strand:- start:111 stop:263 length:153 start_codon:yes stop_codon:yes gene_type:complete
MPSILLSFLELIAGILLLFSGGEYCRQVVQRALRKLRKTGIQSGLLETSI